MEKIKAIIDMDIGDDIDDAFALQYAINHPDFEILGVTVMYKNCYQRAKMARALLEKNGITNVGVYMGYDKPLVEEIKPFWYESIGKDGKANLLSWDESLEKYPIECQHAVDFMIETAKKYPNNSFRNRTYDEYRQSDRKSARRDEETQRNNTYERQ